MSIDITHPLLHASEKQNPKPAIANFKLQKEKTQDDFTKHTKMSLIKKTKTPMQFNTKPFSNSRSSNANNNMSKCDNNKLSSFIHSQQDINVNNDSDHFDYSKEKTLELTNDEKGLYGQRELQDYHKVRVLGK